MGSSLYERLVIPLHRSNPSAQNEYTRFIALFPVNPGQGLELANWVRNRIYLNIVPIRRDIERVERIIQVIPGL